MIEQEAIPSNEKIYRVLRNKQCIDQDTGEVSPTAYFLRIHKDSKCEKGLSVCLSAKCSAAECASSLKKHYGVVSLSVEFVRSIKLDVIHAPPPEYHAHIVNVPHPEDNPVEAERIARLLAKESKWILQRS